MNKPDIKKLSYPLWFTILFYILTVAVPIVLVAIEGFNSPNRVFRICFGFICAFLIAWLFIKKFLLSNIETKLQTQKESLEHDYRIDVGDTNKTKWLWYTNELWLSIINAITVVLLATEIILICVGIQSAVLKVKGICSIIAISYVLAYIIKFSLIFYLRGNEPEE